MWHDGEARILGLESVSLTSVPQPGASTAAGTLPAPAAAAAAAAPAAGAGPSGAAAGSRRYVIESANFRLANRVDDGYEPWAPQVQ